MKYLGPLSSSLSGTRIFYVDLQQQLDTSETVSSIDTLTCNDSDVVLSSSSILSSNLTTKDGHVLPANKSISFRAGCGVSKNSVAQIDIEYTTSLSNTDSTSVFLKVVPTIL